MREININRKDIALLMKRFDLICGFRVDAIFTEIEDTLLRRELDF
jgi:hypothetical protein